MTTIRKSLVLATAIGAVACSDQGLHATLGGPPAEVLDPVIDVQPSRLRYDALMYGQVETREVTVRNVGPEQSVLEVDKLAIAGVDGYTLVDPPEDFRLPGGESRTVTVAFSPTKPYGHEAVLEVFSDDPMQPVVPVGLDGDGLVPELQIEPDPLDMGERGVGCDTYDQVTLTNVGSFDLEVLEVTQAGEGFAIDAPSVPLVLEAGESVDLDVTFNPEQAGDFQSEIVVRSSEVLGERAAVQTGYGVSRPLVHDAFEVPGTGSVDILFFVDQSKSISDDRSALAANFASFIERLSLMTPDWRVMVANGDDGCTNSGILTPETDNFAGVFERAVGSGGGELTESGLLVATSALEQTGVGACNEGFGREDALLHVIMVSDEPDQSPDGWDTYVSRMRATRADGSLLRISAVAGDLPSGCDTASNSAAPGHGYVEASQATDGLFLSICSPWSVNVDALADVRVTVDTVQLTEPADPSTILLTVNGVPIPTGWSYDPGQQAIVFSIGQLPVEGDRVEVTYSPPLTCD